MTRIGFHNSAFSLHAFLPRPFNKLGFEQFLRRQIQFVFTGVDVGVSGQSEFDDGLLLRLAEEQADGRVFLGQLHLAIVIVHIHLHLAEVLMGELVELEIDEDVTAKEAVVENEVHEVMVFIEGETTLPGLEEEAFAEFEQKVLEMGDDGRLQIGFGVAGSFLEAEKFEDEGFLEKVFRPGDELAFPGETLGAVLVPAEGKTLVERGGFLALQLGQRPAFAGGFNLLETAFVGVFDREEEDVVGPAEGEGRFPNRLPGNLQLVSRLLTFCRQSQFARRCLAFSGCEQFFSRCLKNLNRSQFRKRCLRFSRWSQFTRQCLVFLRRCQFNRRCLLNSNAELKEE